MDRAVSPLWPRLGSDQRSGIHVCGRWAWTETPSCSGLSTCWWPPRVQRPRRVRPSVRITSPRPLRRLSHLYEVCMRRVYPPHTGVESCGRRVSTSGWHRRGRPPARPGSRRIRSARCQCGWSRRIPGRRGRRAVRWSPTPGPPWRPGRRSRRARVPLGQQRLGDRAVHPYPRRRFRQAYLSVRRARAGSRPPSRRCRPPGYEDCVRCVNTSHTHVYARRRG